MELNSSQLTTTNLAPTIPLLTSPSYHICDLTISSHTIEEMGVVVGIEASKVFLVDVETLLIILI